MRTSLITLLSLLWLLTPVLQAQHAKINPPDQAAHRIGHTATKSALLAEPLFKSIDHASPGDKWAVSVKSRSSRQHATAALAAIKAEKQILKANSIRPVAQEEPSGRAVNPKIGVNFEANWSIESTPPDNSLAISNNGYIVTANNDGLEYYTSSGNYLYFDYWSDFFDDNSLTSSIFDPKVIYDSGADRFVLVVLHGSSASTSRVLVCFSKSNNPSDGWWVYTLTGNPLNNNCWFDFPALGVSNNEVYITGNLFQSSFNQAVVYQISKAAGYAGGSLDWQYWYDLNDEPFKAFTLQPASHGHQGNYGPGIYFVSNESTGDNDIRLWDLTDDLNGTPQLDSYTIPVTAYEPSANALQSGSDDELDNGDCRILDAFYLNGFIHFVYHSDIGEGWNGISYNRLRVSTTTIQTSWYGLQGSYDYSYPALASFSTSTTDPSVMIAFLRSSSDIFPQCRVVNCDQNFEWSSSTLVKSGETYVDFLSSTERWGDYTGMARKHNSSDARVWLAASYGANIPSQQTFNTYKTWVAEVSAGTTVGVETSPITKTISLFPNPVYDMYQISFTLDQPEEIRITLVETEGRALKTLYQDTPKRGENKLTFNKGALVPGTYVVSIQSKTQVLKNEKIIVAE